MIVENMPEKADLSENEKMALEIVYAAGFLAGSANYPNSFRALTLFKIARRLLGDKPVQEQTDWI
jgi:hypothetical protein